MSRSSLVFDRTGLWRRMTYFLASIGIILAVQHAYIGAEERKMTDYMLNTKMRSVCVGRFLIDVPEDAEISFSPAFLSGWDIATNAEETDAEFVDMLTSKEKELRNKKNSHELTSLENVTPVSEADTHGKIFVFGRHWTHGYEHGRRVDENFPSMNAYIRSNHVSFSFTKEISDDSDLPKLSKLVRQVRSRTEDEISEQPGFCFERGIILDPLHAEQGEGVTMFVGLKEHPDVSIVLFMTAGITEGGTLLERDASGKATFSPEDRARFTQFRAGARTLAGMEGQELVEKVAEHNGTAAHSFMWESLHNNKTNVFTPLLTFEMSTGHGEPGRPVSSTLPDEAALALWDRMASSLRIRTRRADAPHTVVSAGSRLGAMTTGGSICSESGWWRCTDGGEGTKISGGRVQYLRAGQAVPQALLLPAETLWQKIRGEQPSFTSAIPSSWTLIDRRSSSRLARKPTVAAAKAPGSNDAEEALGAQHEIGIIGAQLVSGETCTASGWWQCLDQDALDGARWFALGCTLPKATKQGPLSWAKRAFGAPEHLSVPATWQLIRYSDKEST